MSAGPLSAYLVKGSDPSLVGLELSRLLDSLTGGGAVHVEEHWPATGGSAGSGDDGHGDDDAGSGEGSGSRGRIDIGPVLDACLTAPFLADRRVVVVRRAGALDAAQSKRLAQYLADPMPTTTLVLCADDKAVPTSLEKVVQKTGAVRDTSVSSSGARRSFIDAELRNAGIKLDAAGRKALESHLGEDMARLPGLLASAATAASGSTVNLRDLEPFLGEAGAGAPWDLTDALDNGDGEAALGHLLRSLGAGERHPLVVLSILHRHYGGMLALEGADVDENGAARILGTKPFPAGKVLRQARKLGPERVARAVVLLADAELDIRGRTDLPEELVLEVLVGRLAYLTRDAQGKRGKQLRR